MKSNKLTRIVAGMLIPVMIVSGCMEHTSYTKTTKKDTKRAWFVPKEKIEQVAQEVYADSPIHTEVTMPAASANKVIDNTQKTIDTSMFNHQYTVDKSMNQNHETANKLLDGPLGQFYQNRGK